MVAPRLHSLPLAAQEAPPSRKIKSGSANSRKHHLLKYELTSEAKEAARAHFGDIPAEEAGMAVWDLQ